jgi:hypothetical protein
MKKKISIVIGGLLAALLVFGALGATNVLAQGPTDFPVHGGRGPGGRGLSDAALEAAAKALDMTVDEVKSALQSGRTLQDLADDAGVDIEDVRAAIQAVHETEMRERIAQAVEDGTITQEHADWLLEGLDMGFLGGPGGFGFGHGPKGEGQPPFGPQNQSGGN